LHRPVRKRLTPRHGPRRYVDASPPTETTSSQKGAGVIWTSWDSIGRVLLVGVLAYPLLVVLLRASGKRTLSKMNAFDFVVTVALGSTLAAMLTNASLSLLTGMAALALLVLLQFVVAWTSVRLKAFERLVKSEPSTLVRDGQFCQDVMRSQRVSQDEIRAAVRKHGVPDVQLASVVVLESDGTLSVIARHGSAPDGRRTSP
jgi:uncharacterized membrane protein YcaP (DUF421 family)